MTRFLLNILLLVIGVGNCDSDFSLDRLSELISSNSRYVPQVINDKYNKSFRTFVNKYRIKEAQLRLMNTPQYGN